MAEHWRTLLAVDSDPSAVACYRANFPGVDVRHASVADVLDSLPPCDLIEGGPPCQGFSLAGAGLGEADPRNGIPDFIRAVDRCRPRHFLMENVRGLLTTKHFPYFGRVVSALADLGYAVEYRLLDAVNFGVPQFRERVWLWGIRSDLYRDGIRHVWPIPTHAWPPPEPCMFGASLLPGVTVGQALGLDGWVRKPRSKKVIRRDHPTDEPCPTVEARAALGGGSCLRFVSHDGADLQVVSGSKCRRDTDGVPRGPLVKSIDKPSFTIDGTPPSFRVVGAGSNPHFKGDARTDRDITDEPCPTIPAADRFGNCLPLLQLTGPQTADMPSYTITAGSHQGGPEPIPNRIAKGFSRRLYPLECARLQSMPDNYVWPDGITKTAAYRVVGNGQASEFTRHMGEAMRAVDPELRTAVSLFCGGGLGDLGFTGRSWRYEPATAGKEGAA